MTGIFLLVVVGTWLWFCVLSARWVMGSLRIPALRPLAGVTVFVTLLIAPVADEIVGGFQFRALCRKNAVLRMGVERPEGRTTKVSIRPRNEIVPGTAIVIYRTVIEYTDASSGELVVKFEEYVAKGGWFIRALAISESNSPITMDRHACSPEDARGEAISRTLKFSVIN